MVDLKKFPPEVTVVPIHKYTSYPMSPNEQHIQIQLWGPAEGRNVTHMPSSIAHLDWLPKIKSSANPLDWLPKIKSSAKEII